MTMTVATAIRLQHEDLRPKIGSRILNTKAELLSGELSDEINALLERRGVLLFPEIFFTDEEQVAFTNLLGGNAREIRGEEVFKVSLDTKVNSYAAEYLKGSLFWHIDGTMNPIPIRASMLSSKVLPPEGGDTQFANTATSYEALDEETKRKIDNLRVVHSLWASQFYHTPEPSLKQLDDWQSRGEAEIPLVARHKSGRKSLVLGNTAHYVVGVDPKESARILHGLRDFATGEDYVYTHKWKLGDTVIWDNRTSLHRATPYDPNSGRLMHRTILKGTEAWDQA
jgi:alpha-ketoglutarate-dependent taurine dioxygenase